MNNYTIDTLKEDISQYFKGFFDVLIFKETENSLTIRGLRNEFKCEHHFSLQEINSIAYSFHHRLESIKGDFIRNEQTIKLEKDIKFTGCRLNDTQYSIDDFDFIGLKQLARWHCQNTRKFPKELHIDFRNRDLYIKSGGEEQLSYLARYAGALPVSLMLKVVFVVCEHPNIVEFKNH